ncbi:MAG: hypothetical protein AB1597_09575 [Chloroflexota bacterium]
MTPVAKILIISYSSIFLIVGISLVVLANRLLDWSDRTFNPVLERLLKATAMWQDEYKPQTPRALRFFFLWFLRLSGVLFALASAYTIYTVLRQ